MSQQRVFERYKQLADVLGQLFQNLLEVVVHDFNDLDHSIIYIVNGHLSGRQVGDAASELGIRRLLNTENIPDQLVNSLNRTSRGQKFKSASLSIRDDEGKMIGAFCLNFDVSHFDQFHRFLAFIMNCETHPLVGTSDISENALSNGEEIEREIENYLMQQGLTPIQLNYKDKQAVVEHLYQQGFLKKRGAISLIAKSLQLTRQCIYNYLEMAKNRN